MLFHPSALPLTLVPLFTPQFGTEPSCWRIEERFRTRKFKLLTFQSAVHVSIPSFYLKFKPASQSLLMYSNRSAKWTAGKYRYEGRNTFIRRQYYRNTVKFHSVRDIVSQPIKSARLGVPVYSSEDNEICLVHMSFSSIRSYDDISVIH